MSLNLPIPGHQRRQNQIVCLSNLIRSYELHARCAVLADQWYNSLNGLSDCGAGKGSHSPQLCESCQQAVKCLPEHCSCTDRVFCLIVSLFVWLPLWWTLFITDKSPVIFRYHFRGKWTLGGNCSKEREHREEEKHTVRNWNVFHQRYRRSFMKYAAHEVKKNMTFDLMLRENSERIKFQLFVICQLNR